MKNVYRLLIGVLFAAVIAAGIYLYLDNVAKARTIIELTEKSSSGLKPGDGCPDSYTGGMNWVKLSDVVKMVREYGKNQATSIDSLMRNKLSTRAFRDSRYLTWPLDTIKKFISIIEKQTMSVPLLNDNGRVIKRCDLGIKFYYSAYPGLVKGMDTDKTYQGRHTLIMIPTYLRASDSIYAEFSPFYFVGNKPMLFKEIRDLENKSAKGEDKLRGNKIATAFLMMQADDGDVGKNNGSLCPPPSGCTAEILNMAEQDE
jgi:hypothetical protein